MKKILLLIITLLFVQACSNKTAEKEKIKLVLDWSINTNHTGLYVAYENGYFKEEGLDIEFVMPPEDGALSLVASNNVQFGISFQESLAESLAIDNPIPVSAIASIVNHNRSGILSLKETNIKSFKDLENKKLATWNTKMFDSIMSEAIKKDGGDYSKVKLVNTNVTDPIAALKSQIDAIWVYYSWDAIALKRNKVPFNYLDITTNNKQFDFYSPIIVVNDQYALENEEKVVKFLKAASKGYKFAIDNPKKAADILLKYAPELNKEMVYASQEYLSKEYQSDARYWGEIDLNRWNNFYDYLYDNKVVSKKISDKGVNTKFIKKVN